MIVYLCWIMAKDFRIENHTLYVTYKRVLEAAPVDHALLTKWSLQQILATQGL